MKPEDPLSREEMELSTLLQGSRLPPVPQKDAHVFLREIQERVSPQKKRLPWSFALGLPAFGAACLLLFVLSPKTNLPAESEAPTTRAAAMNLEQPTESMRQLAANSLEAFEEDTFGIPSDHQDLATLHEVMQDWSWDQDDDSEDENGTEESNIFALRSSNTLALAAEGSANLEWEDGSFSDEVAPESLDDGALLALHDALIERIN
jgi:hypothetical protein